MSGFRLPSSWSGSERFSNSGKFRPLSDTHKTTTLAGAVATNRISRTYYYGQKGEEIADYSLNYKFGTTDVRTVSIFFYEG